MNCPLVLVVSASILALPRLDLLPSVMFLKYEINKNRFRSIEFRITVGRSEY